MLSTVWTPSHTGLHLLDAIPWFSLPSLASSSFRRQSKRNKLSPSISTKHSASQLPYELLEHILRFFLQDAGKHPSAPCLVCTNWHQAATDILYESVEVSSYRSTELLLRTLSKDGKGIYRARIKRLILPVISTPYQSPRLNSSDFPRLKSIWIPQGTGRAGRSLGLTDVPELRESPISGIPLDLRPKDLQILSQKFASLISFCTSAQYIQAPFLSKHPYHIPYLQFPQSNPGRASTSSLRQLVLSGVEVLDTFVKDVLVEGGGSRTFPHLQSLAFFEFNANSSHLKCMLSELIEQRRNRSLIGSNDSNHVHAGGLLPNLRSLHLQEGVLNNTFLPQFLHVIGTRLEHLTLLNLYGIYSLAATAIAIDDPNSTSKGSLTHQAIRYIKSLTMGVHGALCSNVFAGLAGTGDSQIDLSDFESLAELEIRLTEGFGLGEREGEQQQQQAANTDEWKLEPVLAKYGFPEEWVLFDTVPDSLKVVRLVGYSPKGDVERVDIERSRGKLASGGKGNWPFFGKKG